MVAMTTTRHSGKHSHRSSHAALRSRRGHLAHHHGTPRYPVFIATGEDRRRIDLSAAMTEEPSAISLKLRERGMMPYRVHFDPESFVWVVSVIDWKSGIKA